MSAVLVAWAALASAQPVLTNSYNPGLGTTVTTVQCDTSGVEPGPAGAGQVWTFNLSPIASPFTRQYIHPAFTSNASYFPNANLAVLDEPDDIYYRYYKAESDKLVYLGYGGYEVEYFDDGRIDLVYPFAFGDSFDDPYSLVQPIIGPFYASGETSVAYDAYGTLIINGHVFANAVRILTQSSHTFSGSSIPSTFESYEWIDPTMQGQVLLRISVRYGSFKTVQVADFVLGVGEPRLNIQLKVYPTVAANDGVTVSFKLSAPRTTTLNVFNALGQCVASKELKASQLVSERIDTNGLPVGMYVVQLSDENGLVAVSRFVVQ